MLVAIGFSHQTCLPAFSAAIAISAWKAFGVVIETTSTSGWAISACQSAVDSAKPSFSPARCAARASSTSQSMASFGRGTSPKTGATAFQASAWHLPI
jgi:hypothetical protein